MPFWCHAQRLDAALRDAEDRRASGVAAHAVRSAYLSSYIGTVASLAEPVVLSLLDATGGGDVLETDADELARRAPSVADDPALSAMADRLSALADLHASAAVRLHGALEDDGSEVSHVALLGDIHPGGAVALLFRDAKPQEVFKPRSLAVDELLRGVLDVVREHAPDATPEATVSRDAGAHGFQRFVSYRSPETAADRAGFFRRFGGLTALAYALAMNDLHRDNIVCAGASPVVVDAECAFGLDPRAALEPGGGEWERPQRSVLDSLLLPNWMKQYGSVLAYDPSALGGSWDAARAAQPQRHGRDDAGRLTWVAGRRDSPPAAGNMPLTDPGVFPAAGHGDDILQGFDEVAAALSTPAVREQIGARLRGAPSVRSRILFRSTFDYAARLRWSSPVRPREDGSALARWVADAEGDAIERGAVPLFTQDLDGTALESEGSPSFAMPESVRGRMREWFLGRGASDFGDQRPLVRASLVLGAEDPDAPRGPERPRPGADAEQVLVGRLVATASRGEGAMWWPSVRELDPGRWQLTTTAPSAYGGLAGIVLALGVAARTHPAAQTAYERGRDVLRGLLDDAAASARGGEGIPGSVFTAAPVGALLALTSCAQVHGDSALTAELTDRAAALLPRLDLDGIDVISGVAGAILAVQRLGAVLSLPDADAVEERLLARMTDGVAAAAREARLKGGLAHGVSGIVLALSRSTVVGEAERRTSVGLLLSREEEILAGARRRTTPDLAPLLSASWCWGAAGQMLARLEAGDTDGARQRRPALAPSAHDLTLCHGAAGIWALQSSRRYRARFGDADAAATARFIDARLEEDLAPRAGMPSYAGDPGLFTGDAGLLLHLCARRDGAEIDPATLAYTPAAGR